MNPQRAASRGMRETMDKPDGGHSALPHDWPNRSASRFVQAGAMRWHVQIMGDGPTALLLHGTGAATHSFRDLAPLLARRFRLIVPDLPGHGYSDSPPGIGLSMPNMSTLLKTLLTTLNVEPSFAAGHSAGAAILVRMCLDGLIAPRGIASLNGALLPLYGLPGRVFSPLAKLLARTEIAPQLFSLSASRSAVTRLLRDTGSHLDQRGIDLYARLARQPRHVSAALSMMAHWDLDRLAIELPDLHTPLLCLVGGNDATIPPSQAVTVTQRVSGASRVEIAGLGHLAHEERPRLFAALLSRAARGLDGR